MAIILLPFLVGTIAFVGALIVAPLFLGNLQAIAKWSDSWLIRFLMLLFVLSLAGSLYLLRRQALLVYAVAEFTVGVVAIWSSFDDFGTSGQLSAGLKIAGGMYIVVRALDNWSKAREEMTAWRRQYAEWEKSQPAWRRTR